MRNKEDKKCEECFGTEFTIDETKGERICDGCGLVAVENVALDVSGNGGYAIGDSAGTHFNKIDTLDNSNKLGTSKFIKVQDLSGVNSNLRRVLKNEQKFNGKARERHPFTLDVYKYVKKEFGEDTAIQAMPLIRMACFPLDSTDIRRIKAEYPQLRKRLKLPKNVFCHGKQKGADQRNIAAVGLACVDILFQQKPGAGAELDKKIEKASLTKKAVSVARRNIMAYWKGISAFKRFNDEAIQNGKGIDIFPAFPEYNMKAVMYSRDQEIQSSIANLEILLTDEFSEAYAQDISRMIYENLGELGEGEDVVPTSDPSLAATSNLDVKMLVAIMCFSILQDEGLSEGLQAKVANECSQSGPGLSMALKRIRGLISAEKFAYEKAFKANRRPAPKAD